MGPGRLPRLNHFAIMNMTKLHVGRGDGRMCVAGHVAASTARPKPSHGSEMALGNDQLMSQTDGPVWCGYSAAWSQQH